MRRPEDSRYDEFVAAAYEAVLHPNLWGEVLNLAREYVRGAGAILYLEDKVAKGGNFLLYNDVDRPHLAKYSEYYRLKDPGYIVKLKRPVGTITATNFLVPDEIHRRSEYYTDFQKPLGIFYQAGVFLYNDASRLATFNVQRARSEGAFTQEDLRRQMKLYAHIRRAFQLSRHFSAQQYERMAFAELLQRVSLGVFLLAADGHVVFMNERAENLAAAGSLRLDQGRLTTAAPEDQRALNRLVRDATQSDAPQGLSAGGGMTVHNRQGQPVLLALVTPLRVDSVVAWEQAQVRAAVLVSEPGRSQPPMLKVLVQWFGLTPQEARVAAELAHGHSPEEISARLAMKWHTVRTHQRAVYDKLGVRTQTQLARIILTSPAMLQGRARGK